MSNRSHKAGIYWAVFVFASCFSLGLFAQNFPLGGVAPYGNPDQNLNAADLLILQRMVSGDITPTNNEILLGDVAPIGQGDNTLNAGDLVVLERAILGLIDLGTINLSSLQPPNINAGISPTENNPYEITGTATPGLFVDVYTQGPLQQITVQQVTVQPDGTFSANVYLYDDANNIYAVENDGVDVSPSSNIIEVQYNNVINRSNLPTNISVDTVWTPGSAPFPYIIPATLTVDAGVNFIIQPGTELKFELGAGLAVNGNLIVEGSSVNKAMFTAYNDPKISNAWQGITINDGGVVNINHAVIEYANRGLQFNSGSGGEVHNSKIENNQQYGIYAQGDGVNLDKNPLPIITLNSIHNNGSGNNYGVNSYESSAGVSLDATNNWWGTTAADDIVSQIDAFSTSGSPLINVSTVLTSEEGPIHDTIILHGTLPSTNFSIYGKAEIGGRGISGTQFLLQNNQTLTAKSGSLIDTGNNSFLIEGAMILEGGSTLNLTSLFTMRGNLTMDDGSEFIASGGSTISGNMVMNPGSRYVSSFPTCLSVTGQLTAVGTTDNPIIFTSAKGVNYSTAGDWGGLCVDDGGNIEMEYAEITYANQALYFTAGSAGTIHNSTITNNRAGLQLRGDNVNVLKNPNVIVTHNNIYNNQPQNANFYTNFIAFLFADASSVILNATDNWWGSTDADQVVSAISHYESSTPYIDVRSILNSKNGVRHDIKIWHSRLLVPNTVLTGKVTIGSRSRVAGFTIKPGETLTLAANSVLTLSQNDLAVNNSLIVDGDLTMQQDSYLMNNGDGSVVVNGSMLMQQGSGISFNDSNATLTINGNLTAAGMLTNRVKFTSRIKSGTKWAGIVVNDGGNADIDYGLVEHARRGIRFWMLSSGTISNTIFSDNEYGLYINGAANLIISSNTIVDNVYGIYLKNYLGSNPNPSITNNDIYENGYNLTLDGINSTTPLNISGNWWGTSNVTSIRSTIREVNSDQTVLVLLDAVASQAYNVLVPINLSLSQSSISPKISLGSQDDTRLTASFYQAANWQVELKNDAGVPVKTYSSTGYAIDITWDGKDAAAQFVPDGIYSVVLSVDGVVVRDTKSIIVDNTLPVVAFSAGLENSVNTSFNVIIDGSANDTNLSYYLVEYSGDGIYWSSIESLKREPIYNGQLVNWSIVNGTGVTVIPNGVYSIKLTASDLAGNTNTLQMPNVEIKTLSLSGVSHDVITITPVNDDVSTISFTLNAPATVTVTISDERSGAVVRTIEQIFTSGGLNTMPWDGKDDIGNYVNDEAYIYNLVADDGTQQITYIPNVNPNVYGVNTGILNVDFNVTKNEFYMNTLTTAVPSRVKFCVHPLSTSIIECDFSSVLTLVDEPFEALSSQYFYWNGRDLLGNAIDNFTYRFVYPALEVLPANTIIVKGTSPFVSGGGVAPNIEVKSNPYLIRHSYEEFSQIKFQVDQGSIVTAKLLPPGVNDPNDSSAIILLDAVPLIADELKTITWMGYSDLDTNNILVNEEGMYTFTIEATSNTTGFTTLYRGAVTLHH